MGISHQHQQSNRATNHTQLSTMEYGDSGTTDGQHDDHYDARYDIETDEFWTFTGTEADHHEAAIEHNPFVDDEVF